MSQINSEHERCIEWMNQNYENCQSVNLTLDHFPDFVKQWITDTWVNVENNTYVYEKKYKEILPDRPNLIVSQEQIPPKPKLERTCAVSPPSHWIEGIDYGFIRRT